MSDRCAWCGEPPETFGCTTEGCGSFKTPKRYRKRTVPVSRDTPRPKYSTDPKLNAALEEDARKLESMGADPGITLDSFPAPTAPRERETPKCGCNFWDGPCAQCESVESPAPVPPVAEAYCLAHKHTTRDEETICSLRFQLAERDREHQAVIETAWWVIPLLRDATKPTNAEFLGRIWSEAACKRLAALESYFDRFPLPTPTPETSK